MTENNKEKEYALFTGCVVPIHLPHIEKLSRQVFSKLGIKIRDLDFTCCPVYSVRDIDEQEWLIIAARNLALAEEKSLDIISLCNGCSQTLIEVHELLKDNDLRKEINEKLKPFKKQYNGNINVYHFMMFFDEIKEKIKPLIKNQFKGFKIATHTGCHLLRPSKIIGFDNAENPEKFDEFVEMLGAKSVDYNTKTLCCGSTMITREKPMSVAMMKDKLEELNHKKIDLLTVCCPSCFIQYDKNQILVKVKYKHDYKIPVIHIMQLLGLALGMNQEQVFLKNNRSLKQDIIQKIVQ
jgi:heterodisulfide reductase subunit B